MRLIAALAAFAAAAAAAELLWRGGATAAGGAVLLLGISAAAVLDGVRAGLLSAAVGSVVNAHWSSAGGQWLATPEQPLALLVMVAAGFGNAILVGALFRREQWKRLSENCAAARFQALFQSDLIGIFIANAEGNILEANNAFLSMIGYPREGADRSAYPPYDHITASGSRPAELRDVIRSGKPSSWYCEYARLDGTRLPALVGAVPIQTEPGHAICFSVDMSSVRRTERSLQTLSGKLLRLHDDERRRIARELHDATAQNLAALSMNLTMLEQSPPADDRGKATVAECATLTEECLRQVRSLSYYLHPPLLDELGLGSALRAYLNAFTRRTGIQVALDIPNHFRRLDRDRESALFRIAQEALENVRQHSASDRAELRVARTAEGVELTVRDFGTGFDEQTAAPDPAAEGVGIAAMRERARQFSGRIEMSRADPGLLVRVVIPGE